MIIWKRKNGELRVGKSGSSAPKKSFNKDGTSEWTNVDVTITSAQLLALNATPQTIVAAPGAGYALIFGGIAITKPAGTAYAGIAAGEDLSVKYTDGSGLEQCQVETTGFLDQTTSQSRYGKPHTAASGVSSITPVANSPFVLQLLTGEITTGNSPLYCRVWYKVIPLPLLGT